MQVNMMKPKNPISESGASVFDSVVGDAIDAMGMECPEHALKIYKSNQDFKFLLVHPVRNFFIISIVILSNPSPNVILFLVEKNSHDVILLVL